MMDAAEIRRWCEAEYGSRYKVEEIEVFIGECLAMNLDPRMRPRTVILRVTPDGRPYAHRLTGFMEHAAEERLRELGRRGQFGREEIWVAGLNPGHIAKCAEYGLDQTGDLLCTITFSIDEQREYYAEVDQRYEIIAANLSRKPTFEQRMKLRAEIFAEMGEPPKPREYVGIGILPASAPHEEGGRRRNSRQQRVVLLAKRDAIDQAFPTLFRELPQSE